MYLAQSTNWGHFPERNRSTRRKPSRSKDENQQQTQPMYDAESRNRTQAIMVGGERSHHCAIHAPRLPSLPHALPQYLSDDIERLQKRALCIMCPNASYNEELEALGIPTLFCRRQEISNSLFREIVQDKNHKLQSLLPN